MAFHVISVRPGLSEKDRTRANDIGPPFASLSGGSYADLLDAAGFDNIEETDLTAEYRQTIERWHAASAAVADELEHMLGHKEFREVQLGQLEKLAAIDDGLLIRSQFVAVAC